MKRIHLLLGRALLAPLSWIPLSRVYGRIVRLRRPRFLARWLIRRFQRHYGIAMDGFRGAAQDYPSLADFFLRPLDPGKRPLPVDPSCLLSPADGRLSELELVTGDAATQVKGWTYPLSLLLGEAVDFSPGWHVATIYLSPRDYHRFHYPLSGRISGAFHGGARLFPVNGFSASRVRRLYVRNERVVTRFDLGNARFYMVAVGATFVGSIGMKHLPGGLPALDEWRRLDLTAEQMAEMGHFAMGSTIILVIPADRVGEPLASAGAPLRVGQPLFRIRG
jgi:phosphatidylserine decarboxylase